MNYLYYGTYDHIQPKGSSSEERLHAEYGTNIQVYTFCRQMGLFSLQDLAKREIERLGKLLSFITIADQSQSAYPDIAADDVWFINYLETVIKSIPPNEPASWVEQIPDKKTLKVNDVLLQGFLKSRCDQTRQNAQTENVIPMTPKVSEPDTPTKVSASRKKQPALDSFPPGSWTETELDQHHIEDSEAEIVSPTISIEFIKAIKSKVGDSFAYHCIMNLSGKLRQ